MYSDVSCENTVFWCILVYSEMYSCILWFAIGIHCALCILVYSVCILPTCILSRGWNTLGYTQNTLRYTYPHPHTWPDPCASGIHQDTTGYNRIHPLVRIPTGCTRYLQIRPEYEEDLVSASYSPHCSRSTCPAAQGPASAPHHHRWSPAPGM